MKLVFSEAPADYANYLFPYAVWAFRDADEAPARLFDAGFLPSGPQLSRFYLCRHIRVALPGFEPTSENRRILRKGARIRCERIALSDFTLTPGRREFCLKYAEARIGAGVIGPERLERIFSGNLANSVLLYTDESTGKELGIVAAYVEAPAMAFYSYAFYDLDGLARNLGMYLMTRAVDHFADDGFRHLYLGTCYSESALYKAQFPGTQFFNGVRWSTDLAELRHLIRKQPAVRDRHLFESPEYMEAFWPGGQPALVEGSQFEVKPA